jgi:chromosome segregation protein
MRFEKLRIVGFKTFVDATEFQIEPGLTGVVGPNGCGKSNLVEALRWVMGETSHKSMRGSDMDDVIFSGSAKRPSRNHAEVTLFINTGESPGLGADTSDILEVSRRIERETGSTYRVNGRETRARDVQLLFADAATGARSPSLVRQGQIGEIIAAKPQARRRILEDAAGIAGLHSRRHEAELRLRSAEDNLARVEDVLRHLEGQIESLGRQARQASRYRDISQLIRKSEALVFHVAITEAQQQRQSAARDLDAATRIVAERTRAQGEAARAHAVAEHALEPLRQEEAERAAAIQRMISARDRLDDEERRALARAKELGQRLAELQRDAERGRLLAEDAGRSLASLSKERKELGLTDPTLTAALDDASRTRAACDRALAQAEEHLQIAQAVLSDATARQAAAEGARRSAHEAMRRAMQQLEDCDRQLSAIPDLIAADTPDTAALRSALDLMMKDAATQEAAAVAAEAQHAAARDAEAALRPALAEAERASQRLETERRTLRSMLGTDQAAQWPPVLDLVEVSKGFETAFVAALGDDLDAALDPAAPIHWRALPATDADASLPEGTVPLAAHVLAPPALARRLAQIGIVSKDRGAALQEKLVPGQRLVSLNGDVWRWDGLRTAADASSPAARRLAQKNRLADLDRDCADASANLEQARSAMDAASAQTRAAAALELQARTDARARSRAIERQRDALAAAERKAAGAEARRTALQESRLALAANATAATRAAQEADAAVRNAPSTDGLRQAVSDAQLQVAHCRSESAQARTLLNGLERDQRQAAERGAAIEREQMAWQERLARAETQIQEVEERLTTVKSERDAFDGVPAELMAQRRALHATLNEAEARLRQTADRRATAETQRSVTDEMAKSALAALTTAREQRARAEALLEAAEDRLQQVARAAVETFDVAPERLVELVGLAPGAPVPSLASAEEKLAALKRERERLGAVNLRAEEELADVSGQRTQLVAEVGDVNEAIRKLRRGIHALNEEGRQRLLASFTVVNAHFQSLFATLFGGGDAELQLIEADDPLEAGLEILAKPPGKRPQVLTLLSGGEQALTAIALIFAVFLTNPSPICVLDEIDAPLDDHNVERLCDLLDSMARQTATRFIIITHNPITMARMDRLFGVTMAERGVSQLVSVDLAGAERIVETV